MKVYVLGSGSAGNSVLIEAGRTRLLVDAGFSARDLERRLAAVDIEPESICGLVITHDHSDHTRGMGVVARKWGLPLYVTAATHAVCSQLLSGNETVHSYSVEQPLQIDGLTIHPFITVHDAVDPVAVTVTEDCTGERLGIATDLGRATASIRHALTGCDVLVLESNHDEILLRHAPYPWSVKARIGGSHGHLSNRAAAELAIELFHPGLTAVVLAHLSERANDPALALETVGAGLQKTRYKGTVEVARQDRPMEPIDVSALRRQRTPPQYSLL